MLIHWFDLFAVFFLAASAAWSYFRGFAKEVFSILAIVAGAWIAATYYPKAAPVFRAMLGDRIISDISAFLALFFLAVIIIVVTGILVRRMLKVSATLTAVDKIAGAALGVVKGALILAIITYPLALIPELKDEVAKGSVAAPILAQMAGMIMDRIAPGLAKGIDSTVKKTKEAGQKAGALLDKAEQLSKIKKEFEEKLAPQEVPSEKPELPAGKTGEAQKPQPVKKAPEQAKAKAVTPPKEKPVTAKKEKKEEAKSAKPGKTKPEKDAISDYDKREMDQLLEKVDKSNGGK
ncbi:MAG: CvpA family protein [Nitrospinae bacterium]|nr:CvpA family protein [Nitrospinota bacterium]